MTTNGITTFFGSTGTVTPTGTFTPAPVAERLNPFLDPGPFGAVVIGNFTMPGVVASIDGAEKPEEWSSQKGTAKSNATTVWKGTKLAESIKIVLKAFDLDSFDGLYDLRDMLRPKLGTKPPSFGIINGAINFNGIVTVSLVNIGQPKWSEAGGYWTCEITLIEFNASKKANTGQASPAQWANHRPTANDQAADELSKLLKQAAAA